MKPQTKTHMNKMLNKLKKIEEVIAIYLFGSYARHTSTTRSDIDICVITKPNVPESLESEIGSMYSKEIDLVLLSNLPLVMKFRVFQEGKELFVRNESELSKIKSKIIKEYLDYEPSLRKHVEAILTAG